MGFNGLGLWVVNITQILYVLYHLKVNFFFNKNLEGSLTRCRLVERNPLKEMQKNESLL